MNWQELIKSQDIILLDGAMGTQLGKRGLMSRGRNNLDRLYAFFAERPSVVQTQYSWMTLGPDAIPGPP